MQLIAMICYNKLALTSFKRRKNYVDLFPTTREPEYRVRVYDPSVPTLSTPPSPLRPQTLTFA